MVFENLGNIVVKAANPLAALGEPLYYTHSMSPIFALMCPWFKVDCKDRLFELELVG
jgi:hypothetical protein